MKNYGYKNVSSRRTVWELFKKNKLSVFSFHWLKSVVGYMVFLHVENVNRFWLKRSVLTVQSDTGKMRSNWPKTFIFWPAGLWKKCLFSNYCRFQTVLSGWWKVMSWMSFLNPSPHPWARHIIDINRLRIKVYEKKHIWILHWLIVFTPK